MTSNYQLFLFLACKFHLRGLCPYRQYTDFSTKKCKQPKLIYAKYLHEIKFQTQFDQLFHWSENDTVRISAADVYKYVRIEIELNV